MKKLENCAIIRAGKEAGTPQRLTVLPGEIIPEKVKSKKKNEEKTDKKGDILIEPKPPIESSESKVDIERLKPPPSSIPPPPKNNLPSFKPTRMEIISELKEMFIKRGIAK